MSKPAIRSVSHSSVVKRLWLIIGLAIIVGGISYPPATNRAIDGVNSVFGTHFGHVVKGFVLGLDLQGGTHLEYQANVSKVAKAGRLSALNGVRDVIERRVNAMGVSEPIVTTERAGSHWRISVELAGVRDINRAIKIIGETPTLEFKEQNTQPVQKSLTPDQQKQMDQANASSTAKARETLAKAVKDPGSMEKLAKSLSKDNASNATTTLGGDLGWIKDKPEYNQIYNAAKGVATGTVIAHVIETKTQYVVAKVENRKEVGTEIHVSHLLIQYAGAKFAPTSTRMTKDQAKAFIQNLKTKITPRNFAFMAKKYSQDAGSNSSGGKLGWFGKGTMQPTFEKAAFALKNGQISNIVETPFGFHIIYRDASRPQYDVQVRAIFFKKITPKDLLPVPDKWKSTGLTGKNLKSAKLDFDQQSGAPQVALQFDSEGTKLFDKITKRNIGKPVAIFLDGSPINEPVVQTEISNGQAVITGNPSLDATKLLAQRLQAGALPVPITLIAQQSVGPTLGKDSVNKSLVAGLWGFLFVAAFMLFWYRFPGLLALLALTLYAGISFALFKMIPVTLTLSGIAGFILSVGIAVDANVLVFERLKEELHLNKPYSSALEEAFHRAWPSIRDGNITTLISCFILYVMFSSSVIRGFAFTLALGVIVSLFTAIIVTRTLLRFVIGTGLANKMKWLFLDSSKK